MEKLVIFDCDGVLVDSEKLSIEALLSCLKEIGIIMTIEDFSIMGTRGAKLATILEKIEYIKGFKLNPEFPVLYRKKMDDLFVANLTAIDGISEALAKIRYPICVASSGPVEKIKRSLQLTGLSDKFGNRIFSSYTIQSWKPEPDLFLYAAREMKTAPSDCVVVEDSILGIQAATSAGMKPLAFTLNQRAEDFKSMGIKSFTNMSELPQLIENIFSS
jgi:HAD superfamily hydrolase (TIGR01509 family)